MLHKPLFNYCSRCLFSFILCLFILSIYGSGFQRFQIQQREHGTVLRGGIWYPCTNPDRQFKVGDMTLMGVPDCALTQSSLPLIVLSHGSGGSALSHHDTAKALADSGFVVAAINHSGDNFLDLSQQGQLSIFASRPNDIRSLIDYMVGQWSGREHLAEESIGFFGFSRGGYTGLVLGGGIPDLGLLVSFCDKQNIPFCQEIKTKNLPVIAAEDKRIKSFVIVDPVNLFTEKSLYNISAPVQLWVSELGGDGVTPERMASIYKSSITSENQLIKGAGHFAFLAPCTEQQKITIPFICTDHSDFDREKFHQYFNKELVRFFSFTLGKPK